MCMQPSRNTDLHPNTHTLSFSQIYTACANIRWQHLNALSFVLCEMRKLRYFHKIYEQNIPQIPLAKFSSAFHLISVFSHKTQPNIGCDIPKTDHIDHNDTV